MSASLRLHDALFTATIARFGGHVFATGGDSFAAAFNAASAGIECAAALQDALASIDWGAGPALSVRIVSTPGRLRSGAATTSVGR